MSSSLNSGPAAAKQLVGATAVDRPLNVLFLCTGNSARSILAEALLNQMGGGHIRGYSAGSKPRGEVHPKALALLREADASIAHLRSKSWDEFAAPGAPVMDFVITVCDNAAGEPCPIWPGRPITAHWGLPDPVGAAQRNIFPDVFGTLQRRIGMLVAAALHGSNRARLEQILIEIRDHMPFVEHGSSAP